MKTKLIKNFLLVFIGISIMAFSRDEGNAKKPIYLNTAYSFKERAVDLVSRMTPEEKQSQLGNTMPAIPRLGVNKYDIWGEALHGIMGRNNNSGMTATSFPNSVAVGSTWDPELIQKETSVVADEARGFNHDLIFTLTYWSPVVEPARDPRWGRTAETFGEDPFLVTQISSGFIRGLMGDDPTYLKAVPCGKHYFANNTEFNRHSGSADMDDRDMREYYLSPYRSLIENDKLPAIMTAYSAVNDVPVSTSKFLVDTIARRTYGLDGYVTGDCGAISDIRSGHNYVQSNEEATALGLKSGVDTDCGSVYQTSALSALEKGLMTEADMDKALVNIFAIRMRLGEFDPQEIVPYAGIKPGIINDPSHNDLAAEIASKTPVLLKNEIATKTGKKALPLNVTGIKKIAVLGPQADKVELGDYSGEVEPELKVTPLAGIQNYIRQNGFDVEIVHSSGGNTERRTDFFTLNGFTTIAKDGTAKEYDATRFNASASGIITSARFGSTSLRGIKDGDWTAYDNIDLTDLDSMKFRMSVAAGGTLEARVGSVTGNIIASQKIEANQQQGGGAFRGFGGRPTIITSKINTLGITGPQTLVLVYHEPEAPATDKETLDMAASADVALIFVGTDQSTGREESDRFSLALPGNQAELISAVAAVNPNTIVVIQGMGMVEVEDFKNNPNIPGMIWTGYNGQAQGTAMAKILFGEVNPGGKLSITWYKSVRDLPDFNDYTLRGGNGKTGRTYWYFDKDVTYEFGYGLSYTTFDYSNFEISKTSITPDDQVRVTFDVKNTGKVDGDEIAQVYVRTPDSPASFQRPVKRLKGFKRVTIPAGQTKTVSIDIDCSGLWFWDAGNERITFDQGRYIFEIGASSKNIKGQVEAKMSGEFNAVLKTVVIDCSKIIFRPGDTGQANVTACLSNDSFIDISKAKVVFKSNNPSVASVDEKGKVTSIKPGTASIFAYVTYNGSTVSNSFPVKVMPDLTPAGITVDGKKIKGFNSDVKAYSYILKNNSKIPVVNATALDKGIDVVVTQAKGVPGTAAVNFVDNHTFEKNTFYINFDLNSTSDDFNTESIGNQWDWIRENKANHSLSAKTGSLTITSEPGDVSEGSNNARNLLLQSANNDWIIETKLVASRVPSQPENAGIIAYENDDSFVKLMFRAVIKTTRQRGLQPGTIDFLIEENGIAKSVASVNLQREIVDDNSLLLKLEKKGNKYTAYYSVDGKVFETLGTGENLLKDIRAGLIVCDGVITQSMTSTYYFDSDTTKPDTPFAVSFDYFHITT
ncbi:MAG: glycoside hydrolase family 3 C-terminal domain-containing protein, partial [Bacteroidales bacterium]|nr:glycoside hydrolase family 3 C-terminal domain-containing protein [Bacteroidales bacterium]